ncbi:hypothetical protein CerSpe_030960 [Prunus speciosa]
MTYLKLPITICNEINMVMASFWWGDNDSGRKVHWKKWADLGEAKSCGGLGFRDLVSFNNALLAKQCLRILNNPQALWVKILKSLYFPNCGFLEGEKGGKALE